MLKVRYLLIVLGLLLYAPAPSIAQVSIGIGLPHVSIGINLPVLPQLVVVPGYPVYYAPRLEANYFFYDGMYWVYQDDNWYASSWYNGPWWLVGPEAVPVFILRIPVRYYRRPPPYFHGWRHNAPPRWHDHWGHDWEQRRSGWDKWDRRAAPAPAPLPVYQRQYSKDRYPRQVEQQQELHNQRYRYQPRDPVVRQHYQERRAPSAPAQQRRQEAPGTDAPRSPAPQREGRDDRRSAPASPQQGRPQVQDRGRPPQPRQEQPRQEQPRQEQPRQEQPRQQTPAAQGQEKRRQDQEKKQQGKDGTRKSKQGQEKEQERGRGRNE